MGHISLIFMKIASNERGALLAAVVEVVDHPSTRLFIDASVSDVSEPSSSSGRATSSNESSSDRHIVISCCSAHQRRGWWVVVAAVVVW